MNIHTTAIIMTISLAACDKSPRVYFTPGLDCENNIIQEIQKSQSIDIAVYSITNHNIGNALIAAHRRGAQIRIITDRIQAAGHASLTSEFRDNGIPIRINTNNKIEHNKFAVFDGRRVVTGSYNWTHNASLYNSENCIFTYSTAAKYTMRFDYLWRTYREYR